jgi:hypothetical protein
MTSGPNIGRRRRRQRPAQQHFHQHVHRHQTLAIYQAAPVAAPVAVPIQPPPSVRPTLQLVPTLQSISTSRIYAPTSVRTYSPTSVHSYSPTVHAVQAATAPVQRQDDSFGAFVSGILTALAVGAAVLGSGSSGGRKRR